jgi:CRISPR-associated protein Csb3
VNADVTNPGQFFACCGLLELAHRLWPGAEGWFDGASSRFAISSNDSSATLQHLFCKMRDCDLTGLSKQERDELEAFKKESRDLKKHREALPPDKEQRGKELGTQARKGAIQIGAPFNLSLDWWQTGDDHIATPKTWAGRQEIQKVARACQDALSGIGEPKNMFDHGCVLRMPHEYCKRKPEESKSVEPFYFDARRFAHALDTGFSLDAQDAETEAHPAVELLCLIGLQRFRPVATADKWAFEYSLWSTPLPVSVASAVVCGAVSRGRRYRFSLLFRDDQKRYKAFDFATPIGD